MDIDKFKNGFKKLSLGLRLNNPGCLRVSSVQWNGKIGSKNGFCQFSKFEYGVRALSLVLCKYIFKYHLFRVSEICLRYAPQSDGNSPEVYSNFVSKKLGFAKLSLNIPTLRIQFPLLVYCFMCMELGKEFEIKSREERLFIHDLFSLIDTYFDEYLNSVYYPAYGKVSNICV